MLPLILLRVLSMLRFAAQRPQSLRRCRGRVIVELVQYQKDRRLGPLAPSLDLPSLTSA